ncbi:MAG: class I SAM-dependent methyltransferase [Defluviitaleaceae bacterium]|nr:class I SAM-dependent methyltransferase [Defluviitaleaceae bacterium]
MGHGFAGILDMAKALFRESIRPGGIYADFTMGNGHDTLFMAQECAGGRVFAFDIQPAALAATRARLDAAQIGGDISLILDDHTNFAKYIHGEIDGGMFNLGYLPGGDKSIVTNIDNLLIDNILARLNPGGILAIVAYPGHPGGDAESTALLDFATKIDSQIFAAIVYRNINKPKSPFLLAFRRL